MLNIGERIISLILTIPSGKIPIALGPLNIATFHFFTFSSLSFTFQLTEWQSFILVFSTFYIIVSDVNTILQEKLHDCIYIFFPSDTYTQLISPGLKSKLNVDTWRPNLRNGKKVIIRYFITCIMKQYEILYIFFSENINFVI